MAPVALDLDDNGLNSIVAIFNQAEGWWRVDCFEFK